MNSVWRRRKICYFHTPSKPLPIHARTEHGVQLCWNIIASCFFIILTWKKKSSWYFKLWGMYLRIALQRKKKKNYLLSMQSGYLNMIWCHVVPIYGDFFNKIMAATASTLLHYAVSRKYGGRLKKLYLCNMCSSLDKWKQIHASEKVKPVF